MSDVILCPSCQTAYPVGDKAPGYRFACSCGAEVVKPESAPEPAPEATVDRGAFVSMIWASVFFLPPVAGVGVVLGALAWRRVRDDPTRSGAGFALAAMVLGICSATWGTLAWALLLGA